MPVGERRSSSGNAITTSITANITSGDTVIPIAASTGYPDGTNGPFFIKIDSETIKCISRTGLNLNVQTVPVTGRGWENTSAASHTTSAPVNLVFTSTDADQANEHYASTAVDHHTHYLNNARHDLVARHPASILPTGSPGNSAPGDTASAGSASTLALSDHRHGREADINTRVGVTLLAAAFAVPSSSTTSIAWTTETADTDGFITTNGVNTVLTVPANKGGIYTISASGFWSAAFVEYKQLVIRLNGGAFANLPLCFDNLLTQAWGGCISIPLSATNTIELALVQFNAGSQNTTARIDMYRVAG